MTEQSNNSKLAIFFLNEVFAKKQFDLLDTIIHPDYHLDIEGGITSQQTQIYDEVPPINIGIESLKQRLISYFDWLSDLNFEILNVVTKGPEVIIRYIQEFVFSGSYLGFPPTNQKIRIKGYLYFRIKEDKIISMDFLGDYFKFLQKIGLTILKEGDEFKIKEYLAALSRLDIIKS